MKLRALGAIVMLVVTGAAGLAWHMMRDQTAAAATTAGDPAVPVVADAVLSQDVPIYLTGIGAVQAFNTVTIRSRVDGQLDKVAFTEGQDVKAGDLLAQIDPRPLQAQLEQAEAQKVSHEAQLADAKLDLERFSNLEKRGAATGQSVDTQKALVAQLGANIQADQAAIDNARRPARLHDDHRPDFRSDRHASGGSRQHRPRHRPDRARGSGADRADFARLHLARRCAARRRARDGQRPAQGRRFQSRQQDRARRRHARAHRQPDRSDHRDDPPEGDVPQQGPRPVARAVRQRATLSDGSP